MSARSVSVSKDLAPTTRPGRHIRLICLTGKDKGTSYYLRGDRVVMGRGKDNDISVFDEQCSRQHVELVTINGKVILSDLGTRSGVSVNEKKVNQAHLNNGDRIVIGHTVYKFSDIFNKEIIEKKEEEEKESEEQEDEREEVAEREPKKKKRPLVLIVGAALAFLLLVDGEGDGQKTTKGKKQEVKIRETPAGIKKTQLSEVLKKRFDMYLHRGIREYREENYFRAIAEFDMALTLNPTEGRAAFYRRKSADKIKNAIDDLFVKVKRQTEALKYRAAIVSLCEIVKLLDQYEDEEKKEQAQKMIEEIQRKEGIGENEHKCSTG